ncbi:MAG TPA: heavy metal-binding domain-containing protein [Phycisphaerales bacterium]|nr:heavy metal-binding domain-containing protein [Phycisphaerales bacterium]
MRIPVCIVIAALAGCRADYQEPELPTDHPANPAVAGPAPDERTATLDLSHADPVGDSPSTAGAAHGAHGAHHPPPPESGDRSTAPEHRPAAPTLPGSSYVCPMHPEVVSDQPGQRCPECGMSLVPREEGADR